MPFPMTLSDPNLNFKRAPNYSTLKLSRIFNDTLRARPFCDSWASCFTIGKIICLPPTFWS